MQKIEKYGKVAINEKYRKKKWREWWENEGKNKEHNVIGNPKDIKKPNFSEKLAEFVGIVLGDGSISKRQITITLHSKDDEKYGYFVTKLIKELFDVPVGIYRRKDFKAINYIVSRKKLVDFCVNKLELKTGNKIKQQVDIPKWIKNNQKYSIACVRGLMDTDGSVFTHTYTSNNKKYSYKKLAFTSYSKPMLKSVYKIISNKDINSRFARERDVRIDSKKDVRKYFKIFGSNNPKHLKNYKE